MEGESESEKGTSCRHIKNQLISRISPGTIGDMPLNGSKKNDMGESTKKSRESTYKRKKRFRTSKAENGRSTVFSKASKKTGGVD